MADRILVARWRSFHSCPAVCAHPVTTLAMVSGTALAGITSVSRADPCLGGHAHPCSACCAHSAGNERHRARRDRAIAFILARASALILAGARALRCKLPYRGVRLGVSVETVFSTATDSAPAELPELTAGDATLQPSLRDEPKPAAPRKLKESVSNALASARALRADEHCASIERSTRVQAILARWLGPLPSRNHGGGGCGTREEEGK